MAKNKRKAKEIGKTGASLITQFQHNINVGKGRKKPTPFGAAELRALSWQNNIVRNCITRIKSAVNNVSWMIRPINKREKAEIYQPQVDYLTKLIRYPNQGQDDTCKTLFSKILEDVLVLDNGVVEKVRNAKGYVVELYIVDGATIFPNIDEYGLFMSPAYYQHVSGSVSDNPDAEFEASDLLVFQQDPSGQNGRIGSGFSPVEQIIHTVLASLQAMTYNNSYFDGNQLPPFLANLKGVPPEEVTRFREEFIKQLEGGSWKGAFTNADDFDLKMIRPTNQDMQFMELNKWLANIIWGAFQLSPQDFGETQNVNRSSAEVQERIEQGVTNALSTIEDEINNDLIRDLSDIDPKFANLEFAFDAENEMDALKQAQIDQIYVNSKIRLPNEVRTRLGDDPLAGGDVFPEATDLSSMFSPIQKTWRRY